MTLEVALKILGRDPAVWLGLVAVVVEFLVAWGITLTEEQQSWINAAATALMGLVLAVMVSRDQIIPAAAGLLGAVLQLAVSFGLHLGQAKITTAGALLTAVLAAWLRTQVTAPVDSSGNRVPKEHVYTNRA